MRAVVLRAAAVLVGVLIVAIGLLLTVNVLSFALAIVVLSAAVRCDSARTQASNHSDLDLTTTSWLTKMVQRKAPAARAVNADEQASDRHPVQPGRRTCL